MLWNRTCTLHHVAAMGGVFYFRGGTFFAAVTTLAEPAHSPLSPTNIFAPVSTPAQSIFELSLFVFTITATIFIVVFSLLAYAVVKFRRRRTNDGREPAQVYEASRWNSRGRSFLFSSLWSCSWRQRV